MFTKRAYRQRGAKLPAIALVLLASVLVDESVAASDAPPHGARAAADYGNLSLLFEHVVGAGGDEHFVARGASYAISVSSRGVQLAMLARQPRAPGTALDIRFVASEGSVAIRGTAPQEARIHQLRGGEPDRVDVPTFGSVHLEGVYPGIDAIFHGDGRRLEYDLVVAPGADPGPMGMRIDGASALALDERGDLVISTESGAMTVHRPFAYQETGGTRTPIESRFSLSGASEVRIVVGEYDRSRSLVVDPVVSYASWLGGSAAEQATAIAVDAAGNAYVTGWTNSSDFPLVSPYDRSITKSDTDVFVSKLNAAGTALVWSTYLGGGSNTAQSLDRAYGIAVDASGSAHVTGTTTGSDFPVSANAYQKGVAGGGSFVTKLAPAGNAIVYSTYVVGATANAIAVDSAGNAYVAGSATPSFATTPGAFQRAAGSGTTSFVLKLDATGSAAVFATFLGGSGGDEAKSIAVDARGNAFVGGWTYSADFPLVDPYQSVPRGRKDAFVAEIDATGSRLVYSTRLGGSLDDAVNAIAIDASGHAYIAGETYSADFPVKDGFQMQKAGSLLVNSSVGNAFVAKLAPAGNALVYASFLGGEVCLSPCQLVFGPQLQFPADAAYGIAVDAAGHVHVSGIARSYTFPLVDSIAARKQADTDDSAFVAKVGTSGRMLLWSTFTRTGFREGDSGSRIQAGSATGVAIDAAGNVYVSGDADQYSNFLATPGAFQISNRGIQTATVVKFAATPPISLATSNPNADTQTPITLTATLSGAPVSGSVAFMNGMAMIGAAPLAGNQAAITLTLPAGIHALSALLRLPNLATDSPVIRQIVDVPLACTAP